MSSSWLISLLISVLICQSLSDTNSDTTNIGMPEESSAVPHYHTINNNIKFYNNGNPTSTPDTEKLLNLTGTILAILQNQEPQHTSQPSPISVSGQYLYTQVSGTSRDCAEIQDNGQTTSGIYPIFPDGDGDPFFVSCDMETDGGGWTIFQRREDGSVDFFLDWATYKYGFGSVSSEHWLGNDNIHRLAVQKTYELRVDLEDFTGQTRYANYSTFYVTDEEDQFTLMLGEYSGDAGDSLSFQADNGFTTKDRDNDVENTKNCASDYKGAWWYNSCHNSNLNGLYLVGTNSQYAKGVVWKDWLGHNYSLKKTEMKIRPVNHRNTVLIA